MINVRGCDVIPQFFFSLPIIKSNTVCGTMLLLEIMYSAINFLLVLLG